MNVEDIKKSIGLEYIIDDSAIEYMPSGLYSFDKYILGGGLPRGRIVQFFGPSNVGKSYLAIWLCAQLQKQNPEYKTAWIDAEGSYHHDFAETVGIDQSRHIVLGKGLYFAEAYYQKLYELLAMNEFDVVVLDSIAALRPKDVVETSLEGAGLKANQHLGFSKVSANLFRGIVSGFKIGEKYSKISETKTCLIAINHVYEDINMSNMPQAYKPTLYRTRGGVEVTYSTTIGVEFTGTSSKINKDDITEIGTPNYLLLSLKCAKSRHGITGSKVIYKLYSEEGRLESVENFDVFKQLYDMQVLEQKGPYYYLKNPETQKQVTCLGKKELIEKAKEFGYTDV